MSRNEESEVTSTSYPTDGPFHLKSTCTGHTKSVSAVRFSHSGELLASVSADKTVRVWNVEDGSLREPSNSINGEAPPDDSKTDPKQHTAGINDVAWNCNSRYLATASDDLTAKLWDVETQTCLTTLTGHTNYVFCCQFNPHSTILATGSFDETIRFWDVRSGRCLREMPAHSDPVTGMDYHYDGTVLASCSYDGLLRLWDTHTGHCLATRAIEHAEYPLSSVNFSLNGEYLLLGALNSPMRLVSTEQGKVLRQYRGHTNKLYCCISTFITTLPQQALACGSDDGSIFVWDVDSKQVLQQIPGSKDASSPGHSGAVLCVSAHPTQPLLASSSHEPDCSVKLWSAESSD